MSSKDAVLVIDTAMEGCGVAVCRSDGAVFDAYHDDAFGQAQRLVPMVQDVLAKAGIGFDDVAGIVVCNGPGTFTGIRIGLSSAGAFGLALDIPVYAVSSLQALAWCAAAHGLDAECLAIVETRRQDFYVQGFDVNGAPTGDAESLMAEGVDVQGRVLIGNAVARFDPDKLYKDLGLSRIDVGEIGRRFLKSKDLFTSDLSPIYLRAPDVSQPKNKPRKISS